MWVLLSCPIVGFSARISCSPSWNYRKLGITPIVRYLVTARKGQSLPCRLADIPARVLCFWHQYWTDCWGFDLQTRDIPLKSGWQHSAEWTCRSRPQHQGWCVRLSLGCLSCSGKWQEFAVTLSPGLWQDLTLSQLSFILLHLQSKITYRADAQGEAAGEQLASLCTWESLLLRGDINSSSLIVASA